MRGKEILSRSNRDQGRLQYGEQHMTADLDRSTPTEVGVTWTVVTLIYGAPETNRMGAQLC